MNESLAPTPGMLGRWRSAPLDLLRTIWRREDSNGDAAMSAEVLLTGLDGVFEASQRLTDKVQAGTDGEPLANAASICRWELLILRERLLECDFTPTLRPIRSQVVRELDGAAAAARTLSSGYRFHNLNRICEGGQALDEHLESLSRIRSRLAGEM
jgi:hypothetical protein